MFLLVKTEKFDKTGKTEKKSKLTKLRDSLYQPFHQKTSLAIDNLRVQMSEPLIWKYWLNASRLKISRKSF